VNVATPDALHITELLNRVDNDHELVSVEELLHEVDSAMYAAKAAGRNRNSLTKADISSDAEHLAPKKAEQSLR
jgi:hypothetical protein